MQELAPDVAATINKAMKSKKILTDDQLKQLSDKLIDTSINVYTLALNMFGLTFREEDWDRLEKVGEVFKCEQCSLWLSTDVKDDSITGMCTPCVDALDGDDHED